MTDELVKRLRANASWGDDRFSEAAARIEQLTAERDRLREALKPFAFFFDDDGEAKTIQQAWEIIYRDRVEDWVFYQEIVAARAALKGETP